MNNFEKPKYIVKNCTSLDSNGTTCQDCSYEDCGADNCINRTDCIMKQIVEKCKKIQELEYQKGRLKYKSPSKAKFGREILELLDIEELNKMKMITTDYKGDKVEWYSADVIKRIIPILELYANTWIDPEVHKGLHFDAEPAKRALKLLNEVE